MAVFQARGTADQADKRPGAAVCALCKLGDYESAIGYARRWLALDPLQEAAHRQLMSLFWQSGQRAAALRQYENCREVLCDELGVEPSEETRELYQKIRASTLVSAATLRPKSNLPVQTTPFHRAGKRVSRDPS